MAAYLELCNVSFRYLEEAQADVLQHVNSVSYTHLTLPTTSRV